jgi:hypothetical protein
MTMNEEGNGAHCENCGVSYNWEQLQRFVAQGVNEGPTWTIQPFHVDKGVLTVVSHYIVDAVIPEGVVEIGVEAFFNRHIRTVTIPDTVTRICEGAFKNCSSLEKIYFGNGVRRVDPKAFEGCFALKQIHIKDVASWCKIDFNLGHGFDTYNSLPFLVAGARLYIDGQEVKHLVIPEMTSVGTGQFSGCKSIEKVTCGIGVSFKGYSQFGYCDNLRELRFEGSPRDTSAMGLPAICKVTSAKEEQAKKASETLSSAYSGVMKIIEERKAQGVCTHCGGKFTLLTKTCKFCGKKKDY